MNNKETLADTKYNRIAAMLLTIIALLIIGLGGIAMLIIMGLE